MSGESNPGPNPGSKPGPSRSGEADPFPLRRYLPPLHPEGWRFVPLFALVALLLFWLWTPLGWIGVVLTIWCAAFFRDPERVTLARPGAIVSPADGFVQAIAPVPPPPELEMGSEPRTRVSIFMSVLDVHVNRSPAAGQVIKLAYTPGRFFNASLDKASEFNERMAVRMSLDGGGELAFVQIAGLIARRIRCDVSEGRAVAAGERVGLIRFGSRVDVYLPEGCELLVAVGQRAVGGETLLAERGGSRGEARSEAPKRARSRKTAEKDMMKDVAKDPVADADKEARDV